MFPRVFFAIQSNLRGWLKDQQQEGWSFAIAALRFDAVRSLRVTVPLD